MLTARSLRKCAEQDRVYGERGSTRRHEVQRQARSLLYKMNQERRANGHLFMQTATEGQKRAMKAYDLLHELLTVVKGRDSISVLSISDTQFHQHFPIFARRVGLRTKFYLKKNGRCPAVTFANKRHGLREGQTMATIFPSRKPSATARSCVCMARNLGIGLGIKELISAAQAFIQAVKPSPTTTP